MRIQPLKTECLTLSSTKRLKNVVSRALFFLASWLHGLIKCLYSSSCEKDTSNQDFLKPGLLAIHCHSENFSVTGNEGRHLAAPDFRGVAYKFVDPS